MPNPLIPFFFYGELKDKRKPNTVSTPGLLRMRGDDAAARFGNYGGHRVWGQVKYVRMEAVKNLDRFEAPEYKRVVVRLSNGTRAFAYADIKPAWEHEDVVEDGIYRGKRTLRIDAVKTKRDP